MFAFFSDGLLSQSIGDLKYSLAFPATHGHNYMDRCMCHKNPFILNGRPSSGYEA